MPKGALGECDFIEGETGFDRNRRILDIGCGTGRHAIELTKRGYQVTGIDLSPAQLRRVTFRDHNVTRFVDDAGNTRELVCNERYYVPSEITWLLKCLGFSSIGIFGAKLGAFSRDDKLETRDFEMLVVAEKPL